MVAPPTSTGRAAPLVAAMYHTAYVTTIASGVDHKYGSVAPSAIPRAQASAIDIAAYANGSHVTLPDAPNATLTASATSITRPCAAKPVPSARHHAATMTRVAPHRARAPVIAATSSERCARARNALAPAMRGAAKKSPALDHSGVYPSKPIQLVRVKTTPNSTTAMTAAHTSGLREKIGRRPAVIADRPRAPSTPWKDSTRPPHASPHRSFRGIARFPCPGPAPDRRAAPGLR